MSQKNVEIVREAFQALSAGGIERSRREPHEVTTAERVGAERLQEVAAFHLDGSYRYRHPSWRYRDTIRCRTTLGGVRGLQRPFACLTRGSAVRLRAVVRSRLATGERLAAVGARKRHHAVSLRCASSSRFWKLSTTGLSTTSAERAGRARLTR
jgi:hypothetical protein